MPECYVDSIFSSNVMYSIFINVFVVNFNYQHNHDVDAVSVCGVGEDFRKHYAEIGIL